MKINLTAAQIGAALEDLGAADQDALLDQMAEIMARWNDDAQAQLISRTAVKLIGCVEEVRATKGMTFGADYQWSAVGKHLVDCRCSDAAGRRAVAMMWEGMTSAQRIVGGLPVRTHEDWVILGHGDGEVWIHGSSPEELERAAREMLVAAKLGRARQKKMETEAAR